MEESYIDYSDASGIVEDAVNAIAEQWNALNDLLDQLKRQDNGTQVINDEQWTIIESVQQDLDSASGSLRAWDHAAKSA